MLKHAMMIMLIGCLSLTAAAADPKPTTAQAKKSGSKIDLSGLDVQEDILWLEHEGSRLYLNLYMPQGVKNPPLLVWIHGGGWYSGTRKSIKDLVADLARSGYAVASIDYRLTKKVGHALPAVFPTQIMDCKAAIRYLRANAGKYGYNADKIGVMGDSAGAHLCALLGTSGDVAELEPTYGVQGVSSRVQAVVDLWGPTDVEQLYVGQSKVTDPKLVKEAGVAMKAVDALVGGWEKNKDNRKLLDQINPITHISSDDPPFLIYHGTNDIRVPPSQSQLLHDALQKGGIQSELIIAKGGHGGMKMVDFQKVKAFFDKTIRQ